LERDACDVLRRGLHHPRADLGGAGERDLRHTRVGDQCAPDRGAGAGQDAERPLGEPRLGEDVGHREDGERCLRGRLQERGVAACERRSDLPAGDHRREVPGRDQDADADGLAERQVQTLRNDGDRFAEDLVRGAPPVLVDVADQVDLGASGADGFADVPRLETGEFFLALADQEGRLGQDAAARAGRCARPRALVERARGHVHGAVRILGSGLGNLPGRLAGRRLHHLRRRSFRGLDALAAEHQQLRHRSLLPFDGVVRPCGRPLRSQRSRSSDRTVGWRGPLPRGRCQRAAPPGPLPRGGCMRLEGKVALITGGGSGMGKVASELFAREGASVVLTDVNDEAGQATASAIGNGAHFVHADVSREADTRAMVAEAIERFGRIDVLYNNAGVMLPDDGSVDSTDEAIWDTTLAVNVKGVAFGCKYAIPALLTTGGGSIINVASFVAWLGAATPQTEYTSSKGAVLAMTREIAVEYARKGVRCNALCPGPIETPLLMQLLSDEQKRQRRFVHIPMGRLGRAEELAK